MKVLLDHHMKKQGILLWATMGSEGWLKLLDIPMLTFENVGLPIDSNDRDVWRFAQGKQLILLTGNRNIETRMVQIHWNKRFEMKTHQTRFP
jgi:hypothetical protein